MQLPESGTSYINNCNFTQNFGLLFGGVIFLKRQAASSIYTDLTIYDSEFKDNYSRYQGGVFFLQDMYLKFNCSASSFLNQTASDSSGGLFWIGQIFKMLFTQNIVTESKS